MAISDTIDISVEGIGDVDALAGALDKAADSLGRLDELAGKGLDFGAAGAGADKFASSWESAAAGVDAAIDKIAASMGRLGDLGAGAAGAGADKIAESFDAAAADMAASVDKMVASAAKLDDVGDGAAAAAGEIGKLDDSLDAAAGTAGKLGGSLPALGDGFKGLGDSGTAAAAQLAALREEMRATAAETDKMTASFMTSADVTVAAGKSSAVYAGALPSLGTTSIEQDAAVAQAQQARKIASQQEAADAAAAEESAGKYHMAMLGGAALLGYGVDLAAKLQSGATRLVTSAGESAANIPMIEQGVLSLAPQTGQSQANLMSGLYYAESAGFHGANALAVERSAAQGATAEGAQASTVSNALTTLLNDYFGGPQKSAARQQDQATSAMNAIMASVGSGKMTLQDLATAMPVLLPTAKSAGLSLQQVLGAESTMTAQGSSPESAAQNIRHTITSIEKPSGVQAAEMQMLGINPVQLSADLGKQGLTGTIQEVDQAIQKHMGPGGMVMVSTLNQSKLAAQSASEMIAQMPKGIQATAEAYLKGTLGAQQWNDATSMYKSTLPVGEIDKLKQFETQANTVLGYSSLVKSGLGNKQTATAALNEMLGGQTGSQVALQIGGDHLKTFTDNVKTVGDDARQSGDNIRDWGDVTRTLSYQLKSSEQAALSVLTEAGQVALPAVTDILKGASAVGGFLAEHPAVTKPLEIAAGGAAVVAMLPKLESAGTTLLNSAGKIGQVLGVPGADKLASAGQGAGVSGTARADTELTGLAGAASEAAGALSRVGAAGDKAALGEGAAGAAGTKEAIGETEAAGGSDLLLGMPGKKGSATAAAEGEAVEAGEVGAGAGMLSKIGIGSIGDVVGPAIMAAIALEVTKSILSSIPSGKGGKNWWDNPGDSDPTSKDPRKQGVSTWAGLGSLLDAPVLGIIHGVAGDSSKGIPKGQLGPHAPNSAAAGNQAYKQYDPAAVNLSALDAAKGKVQADISGINAVLSGAKADGIKIPAPDLTALDSAKGVLKADLNALNTEIAQSGKPAKVPSPDLSALADAKGRAAQEAAGITTGAQSAMHPVKAPSPDLSALAAAKGRAAQDGAAVSAGLAAGIAAGAGAAVAAAHSVAAQVEAALNIHLKISSPSKVTEKIGSETVAGLVLGLEGGQSAVNAAATAMGKNVAKAADITSIDTYIGKLKADIPGDTGLVQLLTRDQGKLTSLANQRAAIEGEITDAQQVAQQVIQSASITSAAAYVPAMANGPESAPTLITGMQQQASDQKAFASQLAQLQKEGLNAQSLNQIAQAGATTGLPIAEGITSGGKGTVTQLNQLESQIKTSAAQIGAIGGPAMYQAGQQVAAGLASGLEKDLGQIESAITKVANAAVDTVKKHLKISSPSGVFAEIGAEIPAGLARGIDGASLLAAASAGKMADGVLAGTARGHRGYGAGSDAQYRPGSYGSYGPGSSGAMGGGTPQVHVTYNTTVNVNSPTLGTMKDVASAVSEQLLRKTGSNWQNALPARPGY